MSQLPQTPHEAPSDAASRSSKLLEFATKNFALASATLAALGYLIGTVFLYSYLSFFDWHLIWLVEYSDVLKFGIVAFAFLSSFSFLFWAFADDAARLHKESGKTLLMVLIVLGSVLSINAATRIVHEYRTYKDPQYAFWVYVFFAQFAAFATVVLLTRSFMRLKTYSVSDAVGDAVMVLSTVAVLGATFAVWMRDMEGFEQDVTVNGQVLEKVGVVFVSTHHTVLYGNQLTTIVPTGAITRIQARPAVPRARYLVSGKGPIATDPSPSKKELDSQSSHSD